MLSLKAAGTCMAPTKHLLELWICFCPGQENGMAETIWARIGKEATDEATEMGKSYSNTTCALQMILKYTTISVLSTFQVCPGGVAFPGGNMMLFWLR